MIDFQHYNPTRIVFGKNAEAQIGALSTQLGKKVLIHYGGGSVKRSGLLDRVIASLDEAGVEHVELGGVVPNPRLSKVKEGIALCKREGADGILAVGGGSVIDSAKAIAAGLRYDGELWDLFLRKDKTTDAAPIGVVLTIPAAGSESSDGCVITNEEGDYKRDLVGPFLYPVFAVVNPELNFTLPAYQTACGAADMLAHLLERYFTQVPEVDLTDRMIEGAMRTIMTYAPVAVEQPNDYNARAQLCWAGTIAHNNLLGCGRIGDWASHNIEHELSALYDIAHGAGLAIVFPAWMKYVNKYNVSRFVQFAVRVMDVDRAFEDQNAIIQEGIARLERWLSGIGMPIRLHQAGINGDRIAEMADKAVLHTGGVVGNFVQLTAQDVEKIFRLAL